MASKKKKTRYRSGGETNQVPPIINVYLFMILCIHPLFLTNGYFNLLISKYRFYWITAALTIAVILIYSFKNKYYGMRLYFKETSLKKWLGSFSVPDIAMVCFLITAVVSTIFSKFRLEAFTGKEGRHNGLFLLLLYGIMYFIVTRFSKPFLRLVDGFLISGGLVGLLGITDYFKLNLLGLKTRMEPFAWGIYTSTIGNVNTYTAFIGLVLSTSLVLYCLCREKKKSIFYFVIMAVSFVAIIMGKSDNAYLTIGALFLFTPLLLFKSKESAVRYLYSGAALLGSIELVYALNVLCGERVHGTDSIINLFAGNRYFIALSAACIVIALLSAVWRYRKNNSPDGELHPLFRRIWIAVIAAAIGTVIFAFYYANFISEATEWIGIGSYLKFNDNWGTDRGFVWRCAYELFQDFSLQKKLIGYGPDTFGILMILERLAEMKKIGVPYDDTHNVYLQYLLTMGIAGMVSYVVLIFGSVVRMIKNAGKNPVPAAIGFAILAYSVQAVVNIEPPIAAPVMLTLLMTGLALCRKAPGEEKVH